MTTLQLTIAIAASFAFLTAGTTSRADDTTSTASTTALPSHPPVQSVAVQQRPASTTTTTAASYPTERQAEQTTQMLPNRALLLTGTTTFLVSYVPSVIVSAVSLRDEDKKLVIPVAGPWIDLEQRDCNSRPCGSHNDLDKALIITSGVAQAAGAL
ncbi:MAG: hypothetical protein JWO86_3951, partial [Myxococcaceae bacterium]|nr:hypothetical protein [Myxococcaceae bacterium]